MKKEYDWCNDYKNVTTLGQWLLDNDRLEWTLKCGYEDALQAYYMQPHKWTPEYNEMIKGKDDE